MVSRASQSLPKRKIDDNMATLHRCAKPLWHTICKSTDRKLKDKKFKSYKT